MEWNRVLLSDALEGVRLLPSGSVQCCVTSPPYFRQRDYGVAGQWGQEKDPVEYVGHLVELFGEVRRVLTDTGTVWIVLGDSYGADKRGGRLNPKYGNKRGLEGPPVGTFAGVKKKDLLGVPWMVAFALRASGWYLRQDIIWFKTNPMPESVQDRCTRSHEYIFMFTKSQRYYYDHLAIATPLSKSARIRMAQKIENQKGSNRAWGKKNGPMKAAFTSAKPAKGDGHGRRHDGFNARGWNGDGMVANRKSVWPMATAMTKEEHFASFPAGIPDLCIRAGTREGDVVLDPFAGTGKTLLQASILGRRYMGFDLNPKYVAMAKRSLKELEGLFFRG
jgi:DNA modification methylase